jgi:hypothetical protein
MYAELALEIAAIKDVLSRKLIASCKAYGYGGDDHHPLLVKGQGQPDYRTSPGLRFS